MVWVRFSTFFSNLKLKNQKWTFINVLFSKIENTFEKTLHHSFFSVRLRHFCDLTFMLWVNVFSFKRMRALCSGFDFVGVKYKTWSKTLKSHFAQFLVGRFRGMFWNSAPDIFWWDGAASNAADGWRKRWSRKLGSHFAQFLFDHFWGMFWILFGGPRKKNNIQYSVLEFKVIGIVYIASIPLYK